MLLAAFLSLLCDELKFIVKEKRVPRGSLLGKSLEFDY